MIYEIKFDKKLEKTIEKIKKSNKFLSKKLRDILEDIALHPRTGIGHPEPLVKGKDTTYSRRLSANDRIIYNIYDDKVIVIVVELEGHYNDK